MDRDRRWARVEKAYQAIVEAAGRHADDALVAIETAYQHGETDEFGFNVARDPVHVHDLHATLLHLPGLDHTRLTFRFQGRDFRLTDVHGHVVRELLA